MWFRNFYNVLKWLCVGRASSPARPRPTRTPAYSFDQASGRLDIGSRSLVLRPKTAALLAVLEAEPDRVFSKAELLETVWPGLHVHEQAVFQCVSEIRQAFRTSQCLRTHPGKGYQWLGVHPEPEHPRRRAPRWSLRTASARACMLVAACVIAGSSQEHGAVASASLRIAVAPVFEASSTPAERGATLNVMEMVRASAGAFDGVRVAPTEDVLEAVHAGEPVATNGIRRAVDADLLITVAVRKSLGLYEARFELQTDRGRIEGDYESVSPAWLAQQLVSELNDALRYSLAVGEEADIARHQRLIRAKRQGFDGDPYAASLVMADIVRSDPTYTSARYYVGLAQSDSGTASARLSSALSASRQTGDRLNEARLLRLLARDALREGDRLAARRYLLEGRRLAQQQGLGLIEAAFDLDAGAAYVSDGAYGRAVEALRSAARQYQSADCAVGLSAVYDRLSTVYRALGSVDEAQAIDARIRAIKALYDPSRS